MADIDLALLERIAAQRRFEPRTLEIAKRHFIHGETVKRLATEYGVNVQRVYAIRREVVTAAKGVVLPDGWDELTLTGPRELVERFRAEFEQAVERWSSAVPKGRTDEP